MAESDTGLHSADGVCVEADRKIGKKGVVVPVDSAGEMGDTVCTGKCVKVGEEDMAIEKVWLGSR